MKVSNDKYIEFIKGYGVNRKGDIYSFKSKKLLKTEISNAGYERAHISVNGKSMHVSVHRIVTKTFIENPNGYNLVNHKNEEKTDNRLENLEWCNYKYNNNYGEARKNSALKKMKPIVMIDPETKEKKFYNGAKMATIDGFTKSGITECLKGRRIKHHGMIFKYA